MVQCQQAMHFGSAQAVSNGLSSHGRADPSCCVCVIVASHQHYVLGIVEQVPYSLALTGAMNMLSSYRHALEPWSARM